MPPPESESLLSYPSYGNPVNQQASVTRDGMPLTTAEALDALNGGGGATFSMLYAAASQPARTYRWVQRGTLTITSRSSNEIDDDGVLQVGSSKTIPLGYWQPIASATPSLLWIADGLQQTKPQNSASLSPKQQQKYDKVVDNLVNKNLGSKLKAKCASLLALTGFSISQIIGAINAQQAYSGPDSKNISMLNAGLLPSVDPTLPPQALSAATFEVNEMVSQYFKNNPRDKAITALFGGNSNEVYFRSSGINATTILHESLHSITGLGDIDLAAKLGLGTLTHDAASAAISKALKDNGCT